MKTTQRKPAAKKPKPKAAKKPAPKRRRARVALADADASKSKRITAKEQREIERKARQFEERVRLSTAVCEVYAAKRVTIESACESAGIDDSTFRDWRHEHHEIREIFENAEARHRLLWFEGLKEKALNSYERLLVGEEYDETTTTYVPARDEDGKIILTKDGKPASVIPTEMKKTKKRVLPNAGMVAMGMKNFHGFKDSVDVAHGGVIGVRQVFEIGGQRIEF